MIRSVNKETEFNYYKNSRDTTFLKCSYHIPGGRSFKVWNHHFLWMAQPQHAGNGDAQC